MVACARILLSLLALGTAGVLAAEVGTDGLDDHFYDGDDYAGSHEPASPPPPFVRSNGRSRFPQGSTRMASAAGLNMSELAHHAGECAVGLTCGATAAWLLRKLQSTVFTLSVVGGVGIAAALHLGWMTLEHVSTLSLALFRIAQGKSRQALRHMDADEDGEITINDGRILYTRAQPFIRTHTALTAGMLGGFVTAASWIR